MSNTQTIEVARVRPAATEVADFDLASSYRARSLGQAQFLTTSSGVEAFACCHSVVAGG
jgi:hypothetical protein